MDICGLAFLAGHVLRILSDPESFDCSASELFGISRVLEQRGDHARAEDFFRRAIGKGLPETAERAAHRELALAAKRRRDFESSNRHWEKLLGSTTEGWKAYEQLAIYYEHHAGEPHRAAGLTREALVRLQEAYQAGHVPTHRYMLLHSGFRHRLRRLSRKIENS